MRLRTGCGALMEIHGMRVTNAGDVPDVGTDDAIVGSGMDSCDVYT